MWGKGEGGRGWEREGEGEGVGRGGKGPAYWCQAVGGPVMSDCQCGK